MILKKIKLGTLIELSEDKNKDNFYTLDDVKGISIQKKFIETKADMEGVSLKPYLLVKPDSFAYVTVTSRNGNKITLAHNTTNNTFIVSSSYVVFIVKRTDLLDSDYLFMYFNRPEFDRYSRFNSWGSARETFSWEDMCDIDFELPPIDIQRKYVAIYKSMVANQKAYEMGLEDLKLTCDATIERFKASYPIMDTKRIMARRNERNTDLDAEYWGISESGFIPPKQGLSEGNILRKKCFYLDDFIFTPSGVNIHNRFIKQGVCSHVNEMFYSKNDSVLSNYVELWFKRDEFIRLCSFHNITSVMSNFSYDTLSFYNVPIPPKNIQLSISNIFSSYIIRKQINEKLKNQIKDICPILIKGSIEEAKKAVS